MPKLVNRLPCPWKHASGQSVVKLSGRAFYLGPHGTKAAKAEYDRIVGEWIANGRCWPAEPQAEPLTLAECVVLYAKHVLDYFGPSRQSASVIEALRPLEPHLDSDAAAFGPLKLKALRQTLIESGLSRSTINGKIGKIKKFFKWLVSEQLVPSSVIEGLKCVEGLRFGHSKAKETEPVGPVPDKMIEATLPHLNAVAADMVRLQLLTGCRSGELVILRPCDLDTTGKVWIYTPAKHKTQHRGKVRVIAVGPKAQDILRPYLLRDKETPCFSPAESEKKRREQLHEGRVTPLHHGNRPGTNRKRRPKRKAHDRYDVGSYRRAIHRACDKAFPAPEGSTDDEVKKWQSDHRWFPHQLRHSAATRIRDEFGIDAASAVLGHSSLAITQTYAEVNKQKAVQAMSKIG